eukprot:15437046-Alexandrium_andersonii.AAC.1
MLCTSDLATGAPKLPCLPSPALHGGHVEPLLGCSSSVASSSRSSCSSSSSSRAKGDSNSSSSNNSSSRHSTISADLWC